MDYSSHIHSPENNLVYAIILVLPVIRRFLCFGGNPWDPRVPLQRSKLENRENDIFGDKKVPFWGSLLEPFTWAFWALNPSLNTKYLLREGFRCPKSPFKWFQAGPQKGHLLTQKMSFS